MPALGDPHTFSVLVVEAWAGKLDAVGRCDDNDRCPACRRHEPCPLDVWPDLIARNALGDPARYARGFFETTGRQAGTGAYTQWNKTGVDHRVSDATVWLCVEYWRSIHQDTRAQQVRPSGQYDQDGNPIPIRRHLAELTAHRVDLWVRLPR